MARDDFSEKAKRTIAGRVGWQCSYPKCNSPTVGPAADPTRLYNLGAACHITAAAPGGPRYDADMLEEQRRHPSNGIWMCQTHAKEIDDDVVEHPADLLRQWKVEAEERARRRLGKATRVDTLSPEIVEVSQARFYGIPSYATTEAGEDFYSAIAFDAAKVDPRYFVAGTFILRFAVMKPPSQRSITLFEIKATVYDFRELPPLSPPSLSAYPQTVYPYVLKLSPPVDRAPRCCIASIFYPPGESAPVDFTPLLIDDDVPQVIDVRFTADPPGIYQFSLDIVIMQGVEFQTFRVQPPMRVLFEPPDEDYDPEFGR